MPLLKDADFPPVASVVAAVAVVSVVRLGQDGRQPSQQSLDVASTIEK